MNQLKAKDFYMWGEWFGIFWFHSCYFDGLAYSIKEKIGRGLSQIVAEQENEVQRIYISRSEWSELGRYYLNLIISNTDRLRLVMKEIREAASAMEVLSDVLGSLNINELSFEGCVKLLKRYHKLHHQLWSIGMVPNVLELENSYLTDYLKSWLKNHGLDDKQAIDVFQVLITPMELSAAQREEYEMFDMVKSPNGEDEIKEHTKKYHWLHFGWTGPNLEQEYFQSIFNGLKKDKSALDRIDKLRREHERLTDLKHEKIRLFNIPDDIKILFELLEDILYMKTYRMDVLFRSFAAIQPVLLKLASFKYISLNQIYKLYQTWFIDMLDKETIDEDYINEIGKYSVRYFDGDSFYFLVGKEAKEFISPIKSSLPVINKKISQFTGECAYPGKVKGIVKIINLAVEMNKFNDDDILVSNVTDPSLLSIMKKASCFITNLGGLTCHAAIVARELKVPCVVGTKIATRVLKDGDVVEVDADKGLVKILSDG